MVEGAMLEKQSSQVLVKLGRRLQFEGRDRLGCRGDQVHLASVEDSPQRVRVHNALAARQRRGQRARRDRIKTSEFRISNPTVVVAN